MTAPPVSTPAPARRRQADRRSEAEQRLITAAAELIAESGPASVTLAKVGERAGYSRGLAAHHFGSKAALMERVASDVSRSFSDAFSDALEGTTTLLDELLALVATYLEIIADPPAANRARLVLIADAVAHRDAEAREIVSAADIEFRAALARRLRSGSERNELPADLDPDAFATLLVGLLRGVTFETMLDPSIDLAAIHAEVRSIITSRLAVST